MDDVEISNAVRFFAACETPDDALESCLAVTRELVGDSLELVELLTASGVSGDHRSFARLLRGSSSDAFRKRLEDVLTLLIRELGSSIQNEFVLAPELAAYCGNRDWFEWYVWDAKLPSDWGEILLAACAGSQVGACQVVY
jgi:hypothetical protein